MLNNKKIKRMITTYEKIERKAALILTTKYCMTMNAHANTTWKVERLQVSINAVKCS